MSTYPRIIWGANSEFYWNPIKPFNALDVKTINRIAENQSDAGIVETLEFYEQDFIDAMMAHITPQDVEVLRQWYQYVRNGSSFGLALDRDLLFYTGFEGGIPETNDQISFTVSRAGSKYYINPDTGLVTEAAANNLCLPAGKYGRGAQIEQAFSNKLTYSEDFSHANWVKSGVTVTANYSVKDPKNTGTADKLAFAAGGDTITQTTAIAIGSDDGTFSIWLKLYDNQSMSLNLNLIRSDTSAVIATSTITPTGSWVRYTVTFDNSPPPPGGGNWVVQLQKFGTGAANVMAWGAQFELGLWASSYVPTTSAAVDRTYDYVHCSLSVSPMNWPNLNERGTLAMWLAFPIAQASMPTSKKIVRFYEDGLLDTQAYLWLNSNGNLAFRMNKVQSSTELTSVTDSTTAMAADTFYHIAITWDMANKVLKIYNNGSLKATTTMTYYGLSDIWTSFLIGNDVTERFGFVIDELLLRQNVLSDTEITALYNRGKALGYQRNFWSAMYLANKEYNPIRQLASERYNFNLQAYEVMT